MKLMFCSSNLPGSALIRAVTWSKWSHVVTLINNTTAIEAVYPEVRLVSIEYLKKKYSKWCVVDVPVPNEKAAIEYLLLQVGKPYDLTALIGLLIHRDWAQDTDWWCSELAAAGVEAGGRKIFRHGAINRVVPQHLWMLDFPILERSE